MMLLWMVLVPLLGAVVAGAAGRLRPGAARRIAVITLLGDLALAGASGVWGPQKPLQRWWDEFAIAWIPGLGIRFHLALDGLSYPLVLLTLVLGLVAVCVSWREIQDRVGLYHLMLLWVLGGVLGVFLAIDLFAFYFFWEMMLIPMYFLIALWGHERRVFSSIKFFIYTQAGGLLMLAAILALAFSHPTAAGLPVFDYADLLDLGSIRAPSAWIMLGFLVAFAVKLPVVPLHTWLPDAHTEAPTAGSVILAGLLLKTGAYGLLRFLLPLFPAASAAFAPAGRWLGALGILYGALLSFAQTDLKRLVAYTSVSHMGFVFLGVFTGGETALKGVVVQLIAHGLSTPAMFVLAGYLQERMKTRDLGRLGGLWAVAPRMGSLALFFALASLGLPGLGNFVGEFLILVGAYARDPVVTWVSAGGFVLSMVYSLRFLQRPFLGPRPSGLFCRDLSVGEAALLGALAAAVVALGLYPGPILQWGNAFSRTIGQTAVGRSR